MSTSKDKEVMSGDQNISKWKQTQTQRARLVYAPTRRTKSWAAKILAIDLSAPVSPTRGREKRTSNQNFGMA
jgi:hypothetical protein